LFNQKVMADGANAPASLDASRPYGTVAVPKTAFRRVPEDNAATIHTGRPTKAPKQQGATPEKILQAFNTWSFKREQPDDVPTMLQVISAAMQLSQPVPFVLYWGKGPRCDLGEPDITCLDYLEALGARVRQVYQPGAAFKLIFTDTHATLNGHSAANMAAYFDAASAGLTPAG
jgi:L-tyrosine isonitrile synthase